MKKLVILLILFCLTSPGWCTADKEPLLSVTGSGSVMAAPDTATVRLGVEVSRRSAQEAQNENAKLMQTVVASIRNLGISKEKIQTSGFNIWPETSYSQNQTPKITGYHCSNQVIITIDDLSLISRVIDSGIAAGANNVQGIQFSRKPDIEARKQALQKAVNEAVDKAKAIAAAAGVKLKNIQMITEGGTAPPPQSYDVGLKAMAVNAAETPVSSGLLEIRASVTIVYAIE